MFIVCNTCKASFTDNDLKTTDQGFGCPNCGSLDYNGTRSGDGRYNYDKVSVSYEEGHHD